MEIINDGAMRIEMHKDLKERYGLTNQQAKAFIDEHGATVVGAMWSAYSDKLQQLQGET